MDTTQKYQTVDDTILQLLTNIQKDTPNRISANFMAALDYAAASAKNEKERQSNPIDHVVIRLDASDYMEVLRMYPDSKYGRFVSCDMEHLLDRIKSSPIKFGHTKLLVANLKVNPSVPFMVKEIDYLEKIAELFCGRDNCNVKWGLVKTNSVVRVGISVLYQE